MRGFILVLFLTACAAEPEAQPGGYQAPCERNADCAPPFSCWNGRCDADIDGPICEAGKVRCNGDAVERCSDTADRWEVQEDCPTGCSNNACRPAACIANEFKCDGEQMLFQCLSNGSGWLFVENCATVCRHGGCTACVPGAKRCLENHQQATCNEAGDAETTADSCTDAGCACP